MPLKGMTEMVMYLHIHSFRVEFEQAHLTLQMSTFFVESCRKS